MWSVSVSKYMVMVVFLRVDEEEKKILRVDEVLCARISYLTVLGSGVNSSLQNESMGL